MKKGNDSDSGFFNPRIFAALILCVTGVGMAMFSFASNPSSGTLTSTSGPLTYTAGPFVEPNVFGNTIAGECDPSPSDPLVPCDVYQLTVNLPADYVAANPNMHLFVERDYCSR